MTTPVAFSGVSVLRDRDCPPGVMYGINRGSSWWQSSTEGAPAPSRITIEDVNRAMVSAYHYGPERLVVSQPLYDLLRRKAQEYPTLQELAAEHGGLPDVCKGTLNMPLSPIPARRPAFNPDHDLATTTYRSKKALRALVREYDRYHADVQRSSAHAYQTARQEADKLRDEKYKLQDEVDRLKRLLVAEVGVDRLAEILEEETATDRLKDFLGHWLYEEATEEADGE